MFCKQRFYVPCPQQINFRLCFIILVVIFAIGSDIKKFTYPNSFFRNTQAQLQTKYFQTRPFQNVFCNKALDKD